MKLGGLLNKLVLDGHLSEEDAISAQKEAIKEKRPVSEILVGNKKITANKLAVLSSLEFGLPVFDLNAIDPEAMPRDLVDDKLIQKHHALPLYKRGNRLYIGISEPTNLTAID
ncbi:MAG: type IV-A pilus assembly ATPase PilB, partial [Gammaproteobacteria bacterium]|nr:type IV-A pilus assembly ATPase PilB [Gammaproteobacteria bacterium]